MQEGEKGRRKGRSGTIRKRNRRGIKACGVGEREESYGSVDERGEWSNKMEA